jgi:hypothetical protein
VKGESGCTVGVHDSGDRGCRGLGCRGMGRNAGYVHISPSVLGTQSKGNSHVDVRNDELRIFLRKLKIYSLLRRSEMK